MLWVRESHLCLLFGVGRKTFSVVYSQVWWVLQLLFFFLCFSTFSRWNRLPIRKRSCLGRLSGSTIMNLFWWVRGLTEENCYMLPREKSWYHREEMHLGRTFSKDGVGNSACPAMCNVSPFCAESAPGQATWAPVSSGWAECIPSGMYEIRGRENVCGGM